MSSPGGATVEIVSGEQLRRELEALEAAYPPLVDLGNEDWCCPGCAEVDASRRGVPWTAIDAWSRNKFLLGER
ncbi:hypothetical protein CLV30_106172 [Haloactinopolyspora alba]|uniref:Uncharacterized protein n=1 Tax=Haloactinopolyspora alba TaxID=648780 RepID=A0A2P8E409_9ACTN|nr:hypothetical protein CLV30_106172 [Haloactinopolyspora alba]